MFLNSDFFKVIIKIDMGIKKTDTMTQMFHTSSVHSGIYHLNLNILKNSFLFNYVSENKYRNKLFSIKFKICPKILFQFSINC